MIVKGLAQLNKRSIGFDLAHGMLMSNMIIRKYKPEDAEAIDEIYDRCHSGTFGQPNLDFVTSAAVVELDGKIIGSGFIEMIPEITIIIDTDISVRSRYRMLKELLETAKFVGREKNLERFYMFPSSTPYMEELIKHFNFKQCSPILVCELEE